MADCICRTPAMIGCSFVVDREYFGDIGLLDPGMEVYGAENIELGMRVSGRRARGFARHGLRPGGGRGLSGGQGVRLRVLLERARVWPVRTVAEDDAEDLVRRLFAEPWPRIEEGGEELARLRARRSLKETRPQSALCRPLGAETRSERKTCLKPPVVQPRGAAGCAGRAGEGGAGPG